MQLPQASSLSKIREERNLCKVHIYIYVFKYDILFILILASGLLFSTLILITALIKSLNLLYAELVWPVYRFHSPFGVWVGQRPLGSSFPSNACVKLKE